MAPSPCVSLTEKQISVYLQLVGSSATADLSAPDFGEKSLKVFNEAGGGSLQGEALGSAVLKCLPPELAKACTESLSDATMVSGLTGAFGKDVGSDFASFVRFCIAQRIHQYFESPLVAETAFPGSKVLVPPRAPSASQPKVVFVIGSPGSGRSTTCKNIASNFGYKHLSLGDLLRAESEKADSPHGAAIKESTGKGELVALDIIIALMKEAMEAAGWEGSSFVIEGFPRSAEQLDSFKLVLGSSVTFMFAVYLECSPAGCERRLKGPEDTPESIKNRFYTFRQSTMPVIESLTFDNKLRKVDAEKSPDEVWKQVAALFAPQVVFMIGGPGSGRSTQAAKISPEFRYHHLDVGKILKEEGSEAIKSHVDAGTLVPADVVIQCIEKEMKKAGWDGGKFLVDGFPRSLESLTTWVQTVGQKCNKDSFALFLDTSAAEMKKRDTKPAIDKRLDTFFAETLPVCDAFARSGRLRRVDASQGIEPCWASVQKAFGPSVVFLVGGRGSGKAQMSTRISRAFDYTHIGGNRSLAEVSSEQLVSTLASEMMGGWVGGKFVIYDFPRNGADLAAWNANPKLAGTDVKCIFHIECSFSVSKTRLPPDAAGPHFEEETATYNKDIAPVMEIFEKEGKLRKIDGECELEDVWSSVKEVCDLDLGAVTSNYGMVVLKPAANNETTLRLLKGLLASNGVSIISEGELSTAEVKEKNIFDQQYREMVEANLEFIPKLRESWSLEGKSAHWMYVSFNPTALSWHKFRSDVIGATDPTKAVAESARAKILASWKELGLANEPSIVYNAVHASAGPLEGMREHMIWTGSSLEENMLGRALLVTGVKKATIEEWLTNPEVKGSDWPIDAAKTISEAKKLFELTDMCDAQVFLNAAKQVAANGAGLSSWKIFQKGAAAPARQTSKDPPKADKLTILHFNDVYNVEPRKAEPVGGIARFVTRVKECIAESVAKGDPEPIVLFSGDAFNPSLTSTVTKGKHMVPALNAIGIACSVYGNHDFDFGIDVLEDLALKCNFPWLISNVFDKATKAPLAKGLMTKMITWNGRKLGIMGLIEREWLATLATVNEDEVIYEDFCLCGRRLAKELRETGAELVIALTHMRVPNDELLAEECGDDIDIILGGHDHHYDVKPVGKHGCYVLKSGTDFRDITAVDIKYTGTGRGFEVLEYRHEEIKSSIAEDGPMKELTQECQDKVGKEMDKVVGDSAVVLESRFAAIRTQETNVGNFIVDCMRGALKADMGLLNSGTLRADAIIPEGPIAVRVIVNLLPMLDELCMLAMKGKQIIEALENGVSQYPRLEGRFPQVSGVKFTFDAAKEAGSRIVEGSVSIGGEPLDLEKEYKVVTKDYLRQGKDGYDVFTKCVCLADGEQAGIIPTVVRDKFHSISVLNGFSNTANTATVQRANEMDTTGLILYGEGPDALKKYAINPQLEGRITCLNPVPIPQLQ